MPKISVIVPVYKAEKYLNQCVQSVVNQTFKDLEVILVDDGSPDRCPAMCDEWAKCDSRVRVLHKKNGGASAARNAGLCIAQGEYIAFVDSDDWISPEMYQEMLNLLTINGADMAICEIQYGNRGITNIRKKVEVWNQKRCLDHFFRVNGEKDTHSICNRLVKKDVLQKFSFVEGKMNEDVHACYCLSIYSKKSVYISIPYYHYRFNDEGVTNCRFNIKKMDLLDMWDNVKKMTINNTPEYLDVCKKNMSRAKFTLLAKMFADGYDRNDKKLEKVKEYLRDEVKKDFWSLWVWKMPISRKVLMIFLVICKW